MKQESDNWQERFLQMENDLRNAKEERDALRAVLKGEASPDALSSIDELPSAKAPMRLMSGEEYRIWVQERVYRRLLGIFSAIGIGGIIALFGLGRILVTSTIRDMETKVGIEVKAQLEKSIKESLAESLTYQINQEVEKKVSADVLRKLEITDELRKRADELQDQLEINLGEHLRAETGRMIEEAATNPDTIDKVSQAIATKEDLSGVFLAQIEQTFNNRESSNEVRGQALRMLSVFGGDDQLRRIQEKLVLTSQQAIDPVIHKQLLAAFTPWKDPQKNDAFRDRILLEFSSDPDCDVREVDPELFDARQNFLKKLGSNHAKPMMDYLLGDNLEHPPFCLVAHALALMPDETGTAMRQLVRMAREDNPRARVAAWKSLREIEQVPNKAARHEALRTAWELLGKIEGIGDFDASSVAKIESWLLKPKTTDSEIVSHSYHLFGQILQVDDWESLIEGTLWPKSRTDAEKENDSGSYGRTESLSEVESLQREVLAALIVTCVSRDDEKSELTDKLTDRVLEEGAYFSRKGMCRILTLAMSHASPKTLKEFMTDVVGRLDENPTGSDYNEKQNHHRMLLAAALKRDATLPAKKYEAAIHLAKEVQNKGNSQALLAQLFPAFRSAVDDDLRAFVRQIKEHLEKRGGEDTDDQHSYGLEMARMLASREDTGLIAAIEDENLVASIVGIETDETNGNSKGREIRKELCARLGWVGNIPDSLSLVPGEKLSGLERVESWFRIRFKADTEYRIKLTGGSAELTLVDAMETNVLDRYWLNSERNYYTFPSGHPVGLHYLRVRPKDENGTDSNSTWSIETRQVQRLGGGANPQGAPLIGNGAYADQLRASNKEGIWFKFRGKVKRRYIIETSGNSDANLKLYLVENDKRMLLRKDDDGGLAKIKWYCLDEGDLFVNVTPPTVRGAEFAERGNDSARPVPFDLSLNEVEASDWKEHRTIRAGREVKNAPTVTSQEFQKGLVVRVAPTSEVELGRGFLRVPAKRGQIFQVESYLPVYLLGSDSADFPRLNITPTGILDRSVWWITEDESGHVTLLGTGNFFLKNSAVVDSAADFVRKDLASKNGSLQLGKSAQFVSQSVDSGMWYLPINGEAGKSYRISFLGEEVSGIEMAILRSVNDSQPIGKSWHPVREDAIWQPQRDKLVYVRLSVRKGPALFLLRAEEEIAPQNGEESPFKGLRAGNRVVLGDDRKANFFDPEFAGTDAIVLRLKPSPQGDVAIVDTGYGKDGKRKRFQWAVANLEPALITVRD